MTYRQLIDLFTEEQLDQDITIYDIENDECFSVDHGTVNGLNEHELPLADEQVVLCIKERL